MSATGYPVLGVHVASQRVSDHAAIRDRVEVEPEGLFLPEVAPNVSPEDVQVRTLPSAVAPLPVAS